MRQFGFRVNVSPNLRETPVPGRMARTNPSYRRRLDDSMVDVFDRACIGNNLDAAADVLTLLDRWHDRRSVKYGSERRIDDRDLVVMRTELNRLTALRTS
jgi:hypothetical protein